MPTQLTSKRFQVPDTVDLVEFCFQQGWSDGLPVVPPTVDRVQTMLEAAGLDAKHEVGFITHRSVSITAEKVAINAVMAGCRPEYMPVVVAAVEGIVDPRWSYHGPGTSTAGAAVLMIVNGPIARALDINAGDNLFGPGWRANLTIGRAVRLVMRNVCGSVPGTLDRGTLGHLKRTQRMTGALQPGDETKLRPLVATPDDILVVAAGGRAGAFSGYIPGWSSAKSSQAVTKEIKR